MRKQVALSLGVGLSAISALPAQAGELNLKLELPEITEGIYLRPYVAVWIEKADDTFVQTLSLWHLQKDKRGNPLPQGDRWLNQVRSWWKSSGSTSQMPIDGISSATRAPGEHELVFNEGKAPMPTLAPGKYQLVIEVAREIKKQRPAGMPAGGPPPGEGGAAMPQGERPAGPPPGARGPSKDADEELRITFDWPVKKATTLTAQGKAEIGKVSLTLK